MHISFSISRLPASSLRTIAAGALAASALFSMPATAQDDNKVFFCPPTAITGLSKPSNGIMCDAETCFSSESAALTAEQKTFLLSSGSCRYLSTQEVASYWRKSEPVAQRKK